VRCGVTSPNASHARNAEEEMPRRRATSLMRKGRRPARFANSPDKFFLLDMGRGFL
jgi:hypothetical protein